jgi:hypothetical protein
VLHRRVEITADSSHPGDKILTGCYRSKAVIRQKSFRRLLSEFFGVKALGDITAMERLATVVDRDFAIIWQ